MAGTFFQEFVVQCPADPSGINRRLLEQNILGGLDISRPPYIAPAEDVGGNYMLVCATEMNSKDDIDALVSALGEFR